MILFKMSTRKRRLTAALKKRICKGKLSRVLILFLCILLIENFAAAADNAALISVSVPPGTQMLPRTVFTQTWTFQNTGTTTWSPTYSGYTLNLLTNVDCLGTAPLTNKSADSLPSAAISSGKSISPGGQASYSMRFVAPEASGTYTDFFQLNNASSHFFGPTVTVQIAVIKLGSTNQYDRARAVSYANNYSAVVCSDGYFWTNSWPYGAFPPGSPAPPSGLGDDCAHFVSCCIGSEPNLRGGGLNIPSRVPPTYGEPGASKLVNDCLISPGYAIEVFSLTNMEPGDVVAWNWGGDTNIANLNHVTLYLGNGLLAAHSSSRLDVSADTFYQSSETNYVRHLVHIFDVPTLVYAKSGNSLVLSWTTNWNSGFALYSSTDLAAWSKVTKSPSMHGNMNYLTNSASSGAAFYRLMLPGD